VTIHDNNLLNLKHVKKMGMLSLFSAVQCHMTSEADISSPFHGGGRQSSWQTQWPIETQPANVVDCCKTSLVELSADDTRNSINLRVQAGNEMNEALKHCGYTVEEQLWAIKFIVKVFVSRVSMHDMQSAILFCYFCMSINLSVTPWYCILNEWTWSSSFFHRPL